MAADHSKENKPGRAGAAAMNVLIVGHGCAPNAGSEPGATWNWAWALARDHRVWVITHGAFRSAIEDYLREDPRPNLRFVWVGPLGRLDPWRPPSQRWIRWHYLWWLRATLKAARELVRTEPIDIVHHISWCTLSAPPNLWKIGKPFVWGPVGGGQTMPMRFLPYLGHEALAEMVRTLRVWTMPWNPALRRAVRNADLLLAVNRETAATLVRAGAAALRYLPDIGLPSDLLTTEARERAQTGPFDVVWAGRIERFKGLELLIDVARRLRHADIRFQVIGDGSHRAAMERYTARLGVADRVRFTGRLSWLETQRRFAEAHLFAFTSLRETFGSVIFEAMAAGCPVLCLDFCGAGTILPPDAAVKIPVTTPRRIEADMASAIESLVADRARLRALSLAALSFVGEQTRERRAEIMGAYYDEVLARHRARPRSPVATTIRGASAAEAETG